MGLVWFRGFSLFKPGRRSGRRQPYLVAFKNAAGARVTKTLTPNLKTCSAWIAATSERLERLRLGLMTRAEFDALQAGDEPIDAHIEQYTRWLASRGRSAKHVATERTSLTRMAEWCGWKTLGDLSSVPAQQAIADFQERSGASARTANTYLAHAKQFSLWLKRVGLRNDHPLEFLEKQKQATDRRLVRRSLTPAELSRLLEATSVNHGARWGMRPADRVILYATAARSGLRLGTLRALTPESFELSTVPPAINILAKQLKQRRDQRQPIPPSLAELLAPWLAGRPAGKPVFHIPDKAWKMLKGDLAAAGIEYENESGQCDFHALRVTFLTSLADAGVPVHVVQRLAGHSSITCTQRYMRPQSSDETRAVEKLPRLQRPAQQQFTLPFSGPASGPTLPAKGAI